MLLWLNILAVKRQSVAGIMAAHWAEYGRDYYTRHDYEAVDAEAARGLMAHLQASAAALPGKTFAGLTVSRADDFHYDDPVDGSRSEHQGFRVFFEDGARAVFRLSGTGTVGATIRIYLERYEADPTRHGLETQAALANVIAAARDISQIEARTGRTEPDVIT